MKRTLVALLMVAFAGVLAIQACGDGFTSEQTLVQTQNPIIQGVPANGGVYNAVVGLHEQSRDGVSIYPFCSGTLITPTVVLTAAHCLKGVRTSGVMVYLGASAPAEYAAGQLTYSDFYAVSQIQVHPSYSSTQLTNDIALARLSTAVSGSVATPVPFLPLSQGFTSADAGMALDFAGFGLDENDEYGVRLHLVGELDHLQGTHQIYYYQAWADGGPCSGDSGGPAFVTRNGTTYVGAMTSYGDADCAVYGVSTRADYFESFINAFIGVAPDCSANGVCNPACAAGADPDCGTPSEVCGNGICRNGETCSSCPADCVKKKGSKVMACCGDGVCGYKETATQCPADCQ